MTFDKDFDIDADDELPIEDGDFPEAEAMVERLNNHGSWDVEGLVRDAYRDLLLGEHLPEDCYAAAGVIAWLVDVARMAEMSLSREVETMRDNKRLRKELDRTKAMLAETQDELRHLRSQPVLVEGVL